MSGRACKWVTRNPLLFNDPVSGEVFEIPAGERCHVLGSVEEAVAGGFLAKDDEMGIWAATKNVKRGYVLVWLRGVLRGVDRSDVDDTATHMRAQPSTASTPPAPEID